MLKDIDEAKKDVLLCIKNLGKTFEVCALIFLLLNFCINDTFCGNAHIMYIFFALLLNIPLYNFELCSIFLCMRDTTEIQYNSDIRALFSYLQRYNVCWEIRPETNEKCNVVKNK